MNSVMTISAFTRILCEGLYIVPALVLTASETFGYIPAECCICVDERPTGTEQRGRDILDYPTHRHARTQTNKK